ncbi:hypothetical protein BDV32DRAFT_151336 [Aspergillus pseudonomiae]|nr:hypothetical protein BDV32DRAFT_151336 [Aspergillus pseudonomiae]
MLAWLFLLLNLLNFVLGAPWQGIRQKPLPCQDRFSDDDLLEPLHDRCYTQRYNPGPCHREEMLVPYDSCAIVGPSTIEVLDSRKPHDHFPGQRFAVSREGDDQKVKSMITFQPLMSGEKTCTLAIEIPAMPEGQYAQGSTTMEVWAVDRPEKPTWDNQPDKDQTVGKATFPTWEVQQGWLQRFMPLDCEKQMSYMVELSLPKGDGDVRFWNQLMGKQGAPPIGWRMLQGGC